METFDEDVEVAIKKRKIETCGLSQQNTNEKGFEEKLSDLKEDLIMYYRDQESTISLSPIADEHDVPLMNFYVKPPLSAFVKPHLLSHAKTKDVINKEEIIDHNPQKKQRDNIPLKQTISSYRKLFFHDKSKPFRKIYITADAGLGKTSLSQHITMNWCQSHQPDESSSAKYQTEDLKTMKEFDLLFLLHLREYQESSLCHLDDLIQNMCTNLSRSSQYTRNFLEKCLHEKCCLLILDGLDEWAHPHKCHKKSKIPHNVHPNSCTVLTTLRPWKLGTVGLGSADIDRHVELSELDRWSSYELERNAFQILNEIYPNAPRKDIADFRKQVSSVGEIRNNPYIKLYLICLWYEGSPVGKSKCEIYSNIIELILQRGMKKPNLPSIAVSQFAGNVAIPKCMRNNKRSKDFIGLLFKLGKLAFCSLFNTVKESSLIIDKKIVALYLANEEIDLCLKYGLLCQTKDSNVLAEVSHKVYFQHKSIQEFFAAFYINADWEEKMVLSTILQVCRSLSAILEMSDLYIFLCGINPNVCSLLFRDIHNIVEKDKITGVYRSIVSDSDPLFCYDDEESDFWEEYDYEHREEDVAEKYMREFLSMEVACIEENSKNENDDCSISLQHLFLEEYSELYNLPLLSRVVKSNSWDVKSCCISQIWLEQLKLNEKNRENDYSVNVNCEDTKMVDDMSIDENTLDTNSHTTDGNRIDEKIIDENITEKLRTDAVNKISEAMTDEKVIYSRRAKPITAGNVMPVNMLNENMSIAKSVHQNKIDKYKRKVLRSRLFQNVAATIQTLRVRDITIDDLQSSPLSIFLDRSVHALNYLLIYDVRMTKQDMRLFFENIGHIQSLKLLCIDTISPVHTYDISTDNNMFIPFNLPQIHQLLLTNTTFELPHDNIRQLFSSLESCTTLKRLKLTDIKCSDHPNSCPGVQFNGQNSQLQKLTLIDVPVNILHLSEQRQLLALTLKYVPITVLFISSTSQLQQVFLKNIPLHELHFDIECQQPCTLKGVFSSVSFSHSAIEYLLTVIGSGRMFETVKLIQITCSEHQDSCPGVALSMSQNNELYSLTLNDVPVSVLNINSASQLQRMHLENIPLSELRFDIECMQSCALVGMFPSVLVSHSGIEHLFIAIGSGRMFETVKLSQVKCSEHLDSCPGVPLNLSQNSQLHSLILESVPVSLLNITSQNSQLQELTLQQLPVSAVNISQASQLHTIRLDCIILHELSMTIKSLQLCTFSSVSMPHNMIYTFITNIGNCIMLKHLELEQIKCSDHPQSCFGVPLSLSRESTLQRLTLFAAPVRVLDLSQTTQLHTIRLQNIPLHELHVNKDCSLPCTLEANLSVILPHNVIHQLLSSIESYVGLTRLTLKQIQCWDHQNYCSGLQLNFCQNSKLQELKLFRIPLSVLDLTQLTSLYNLNLEKLPISYVDFSKTSALKNVTLKDISLDRLDLSSVSQLSTVHLQHLPLRELEMNTECMQTCTLEADFSSLRLSHNDIHRFLSSIGRCKMLSELELQHIQCLDHPKSCPGAPLEFFSNTKLQKLTLLNIPLSVLDLTKVTNLYNLNLGKIPICNLLFSKPCTLRNITLKEINIRRLDLSGISQPLTIHLTNLPLRELEMNTECMQTCSLEADFSTVRLSHSDIYQLLNSIGRCPMLTDLTLKQIQCLDHPNTCPGVPLKFFKNSKLHQLPQFSVPLRASYFSYDTKQFNLNLDSIPINGLDILDVSQFQKIRLNNIPLHELRMNIESLQSCTLNADLSLISSHNDINQLLTYMGSCVMFIELTLRQIKCSDHTDTCPGVPLKFSRESKLQDLTLFDVPLSELDLSCVNQLLNLNLESVPVSDLAFSGTGNLKNLTLKKIPLNVLILSQTSKLQTIQLHYIPLRELQINTECLQPRILEANLSVTLSHKTIQNLGTSIGRLFMLKELTLKQIMCWDHPNCCPGCSLNFCQNSKLEQLTLFQVPVSVLDLSHSSQLRTIQVQRIPFRELQISTEYLHPCTLEADLSNVSLSHNDIHQLFSSIGKCIMLTTLTLKHVLCSEHRQQCSGSPLKFSQNSKLQNLTLSDVYCIGNNVLDLSLACQLQKIQLQDTSFVELNLSNGCLQPFTLEADLPYMLRHAYLQQLFNSIGGSMMLTELTLKQIKCMNHDISGPRVPLKFCPNSKLQILTLFRVPLNELVLSQLTQLNLEEVPVKQIDFSSASNLKYVILKNIPLNSLDLSYVSQLEKLRLENIPLIKLQMRAESNKPCTLDGDFSSWRFRHIIIHSLLSSMGNCTMLTDLTLNQINCSDHPNSCPGVPLIFPQNSKLKQLTLFSVPLSELNVSQLNQLSELNLEKVPVKYLDLSGTNNLKYITLTEIPIGGLNLSLTSQLQMLNITKITASHSAWNAIFESLRKLPLSISIILREINMSAWEWINILSLITTGAQLRYVTIHLDSCGGPSSEEWRTVENQMNELYVKTTLCLSRNCVSGVLISSNPQNTFF